MSDIKLDGHKLNLHPIEVGNWLSGGMVYPIEVEISLTAKCNHRCVFCALDYTPHKDALKQTDVEHVLVRMKNRGLKSVVFAGEGEPLLHPNIIGICQYAWSIGLDVGLSTNGVLLTDSLADKLLKYLKWIRFSVGGYSPDTYAKIHSCKESDSDTAYHAIKYAKELDKCVVGVQTVLLDDNFYDVYDIKDWCDSVGVDYYTVKPFSKHPMSDSNFDLTIDYTKMEEIFEASDQSKTKFIFRSEAMSNKGKTRGYNMCHGIDLMTYISSDGNIYPCIAYAGNFKMAYGNITKYGFDQIWESVQKQEIVEKINCGLKGCRELCRLDNMNKYLHRLKHPQAHDNFI